MNKEKIVELLKLVDHKDFHKDLHEFCDDLIYAITNDCEDIIIGKWVSLDTLINHINKNEWD